MTVSRLKLALAALVAAVISAATLRADEAEPFLKPGMWEIRRANEGRESSLMPKEMVSQRCTDWAAERKRQKEQFLRAGCEYAFTKTGPATYLTAVTCKGGAMGNIASTGTMTVISEGAFDLVTEATGGSVGGSTKERVSARRKGDCPQ